MFCFVWPYFIPINNNNNSEVLLGAIIHKPDWNTKYKLTLILSTSIFPGKNCAFARVVRTRSLEEEFSVSGSGSGELAQRLEDGGALDEDDNGAIFYVLLRAVDRFHAEYERYPGAFDDQLEGDVPKLKVLYLIVSIE